MTNTDASTPPNDPTPPWYRPDWWGPTVERRPVDAGDEWLPDAVERVTFRREDFADSAFPERLPQTLYFGADGWPLIVPAAAKPRLDPRCQAELHRYPWLARPEEWCERTYLSAFGDYDRFVRHNLQAAIIRGTSNHSLTRTTAHR